MSAMVKPAREIVELVSDAVGCGMASKMLSCLSFPAHGDGVKWLPWPLLRGQLLDHRDFARRAPNYGKSVGHPLVYKLTGERRCGARQHKTV